jgi:hypothetical protein
MSKVPISSRRFPGVQTFQLLALGRSRHFQSGSEMA